MFNPPTAGTGMPSRGSTACTQRPDQDATWDASAEASCPLPNGFLREDAQDQATYLNLGQP